MRNLVIRQSPVEMALFFEKFSFIDWPNCGWSERGPLSRLSYSCVALVLRLDFLSQVNYLNLRIAISLETMAKQANDLDYNESAIASLFASLFQHLPTL